MYEVRFLFSNDGDGLSNRRGEEEVREWTNIFPFHSLSMLLLPSLPKFLIFASRFRE